MAAVATCIESSAMTRIARIAIQSWCVAAGILLLSSPVQGDTLEQRLLAERPESLAKDSASSGDAIRGARLFYHSSLTCIACHNDGGKSLSIGPDLTKIDRKSSDATLVESVLQPSKKIAVGYETVSVETADGFIVQGVRVKESSKSLVLRDPAQPKKLISLKRADIVTRHVSEQSAMPVGQINLLADRQQFLDLVRFLIDLRDGGAKRATKLRAAVEPRMRDFPEKPTPTKPVVQRGEIGIKNVARYPRGIALGFVGGTVLFDADQLAAVAEWHDGFVSTGEQNYFGFNWNCESAAPTIIDPHPFEVKLPDGTWQTPENTTAHDPSDGSSFDGYQIGTDCVRLRYHVRIGDKQLRVTEDVRTEPRGDGHVLSRRFRFADVPAGARLAFVLPKGSDYRHYGSDGEEVNGPGDAAQAPMAKYKTDTGIEVARVDSASPFAWQAREVGGQPRWRIVSAISNSQQSVDCQIDVWRASGTSDSAAAAELADLAAHPPTMTDKFENPLVATPPRSPRPTDADKPDSPSRPSIVSTKNVDEFAPTFGRFLRFVVTNTTDSAAPGIDELEVFGADPKRNLALNGRATASSVIPGYSIHQIAHLNDGHVGNDHSWISNERGSGWAQIELPQPVEIERVVWARDQTGVCRDRLAINYRIEISDDGHHWTSVSDDEGRQAPVAFAGKQTFASLPGYEMESIPLPFPGCRPSDIAFATDGRMYLIAMTEGQVWRANVPPVGEPGRVRWQRFATGLNQPIGLAIVDGRLYVAQKPEITELIDRDRDGATDHYRTVATGWGLSTGWHEYCFGLCADPQQNLWFTLNTGYFWTNPGYVNPGKWRGSVMRVSTQTERCEVVAKGCRVPNGIALGPDDDVFFTDNQGDWIQSCKLAHVVFGRFYGHPEYREDALPSGEYPDGRSAIWFPYERLKSSSGPVYDSTAGKFGPFAGQMFVGDVGYGANSGIMRVALEKVDDEYQGACFPFLEDQPFGCERMKFGPNNSLYLLSLTSGLQRVRYTRQEPPFAIDRVQIRPQGKGFTVKFTKPLTPEEKLDPAKIEVKKFHYLYTGNYGSPRADEAAVAVEAADVSDDRQELTLTLPVETYPIGMIYEVTLPDLKANAGDRLQQKSFWYTVNRIPK